MSSTSTATSTSTDSSVEARVKSEFGVMLRDFPTVLKPMLRDKRQPINKIKDTAWYHIIKQLRRISPHVDDQRDLVDGFHTQLNKLVDELQRDVLAEAKKK